MEWILIAILVVVAVAAVAYAAKQRRSTRLQEGFGPEYDRAVERHGDRRAAEQDLRERRERREQLDVRELEPRERERYVDQWLAVQRAFVDEPVNAVGTADALVREVMQARGYPVDTDFERRAADVSVDHPEVVEHYRAAHEISVRTTTGEAGTEDLRHAMVHYRALFTELLGPTGGGRFTRQDTTHKEEVHG